MEILFPLPEPKFAVPERGGPDLAERQGRMMEATRALNYLAAARTGDLKRAPAHAGFVGRARRDCLGHVEAVASQCGDNPKDLDEEVSLRQLLNTRSLHGELPQHLASSSFDKLMS